MEFFNDFDFDDVARLIVEGQLQGVDVVDSSSDDECTHTKKPNKPRDFEGAANWIDQFYFESSHVFSKRNFESLLFML